METEGAETVEMEDTDRRAEELSQTAARIKTILDSRVPGVMDEPLYRRASVGIPLVQGPSVLFQIRSKKLKSQPGEICFPGGAIEPGESPRQAVVRECSEELLLPPDHIKVLGQGDILITPTGRIIYPFVVRLEDYRNTYSTDEMEDVFSVPLEWLLKQKPDFYIQEVETKVGEDFPFDKIQGGEDYPWQRGKNRIYFYEYKGKIIWGLTARLLKGFADLIKE